MGTLSVMGAVAGMATGQTVIGPITTTGNNIVGDTLPINLASGDNTFAVPSGATKVLINLGQGVGVAVKVRTNLNSGDAGLPIGPYSNVGWTAFDLVSGVTSIILNAGATVSNGGMVFV